MRESLATAASIRADRVRSFAMSINELLTVSDFVGHRYQPWFGLSFRGTQSGFRHR
jgi:hypothetical protein